VENWFYVAIGAIVLIMVAGTTYEQHAIASSADPLVTACAMGKKPACEALKDRN
jgi:hypothetical protein